MSLDDTINLASVLEEARLAGTNVRETHLAPEGQVPLKFPAAALTSASTPTPTHTPTPTPTPALNPTHSDEASAADSRTAASVTTATAKAMNSPPPHVAMALDGSVSAGASAPASGPPHVALATADEPFIDDEPYIDDGFDTQDGGYGLQRDRRVQNWLAQQCRFSLVFGESEKDVLAALPGHLGGKGKERGVPERGFGDDDEERGVDGTGPGIRRQRSYLDSPELLGSTPAATTATTAPTTVTRTSSGSSRQYGSSSHADGSPAIPSQQPQEADIERADSPLLGFEGPSPASDSGAIDADAAGTVDPLIRPAHNWVRDLPRDDGVSASEWGRFAVRIRDPSEDFSEGNRDKPLPMLPPPSTRASPVPDEVPQVATPSADSMSGQEGLSASESLQQERTPSAVPSPLPAQSSLTIAPLSPRPSVYQTTSPSRPKSSLRASAYPSAHPSAHNSPLPPMQATPLPPSSAPTRRASRATLSVYMSPVDFGDDYNMEQQGHILSEMPSPSGGNRNTLVATATGTLGAASQPQQQQQQHTLHTVRSRSGSVGLRNAVYINSEEVIERLDALLLRSPTQAHENVEDALEDMAIEMEDGFAGRKTPVEDRKEAVMEKEKEERVALGGEERDDAESDDSRSEGRLEAEEMLGELGLGLRGLEDDRLHEMPAVATEAELRLIVKAEEIKREEELELFKPQPLDTLHEHEVDTHTDTTAMDGVTSSVIAAPELAIAASPVVPTASAGVVPVPVMRSRTSSISLAAAGRVPSGPSPAVLHQMHTRDTSSASSSRRMSPSSPSSRLSRSHSQSFGQPQHQIHHNHSLSHTGFSRSGTPSSSRSNSNHGHGHTASLALNHLSGHSSSYSNGSIAIPGVVSSGNGHSRSSSSILLATPATSSIHIALPVTLPPAEPGAPRPTRPPPAPPLNLGPAVDEHPGALAIDGSSLGVDIVSDEFYGDVLGSEESSHQSYLRHYQDSEKERNHTPEHVEDYDGVGDATILDAAYLPQHSGRKAFQDDDPAQLLMALALEDRIEELQPINFPSARPIREEAGGVYDDLVVDESVPPLHPSQRLEDLVDVHGEMGRYIDGIGQEQDQDTNGYPERPSMQRSMSRWSLTSSTMGDDAPKEKKEIKKKKSRKSFSSPFAAAQAEVLNDTPATPGAQDGNDGFTTPSNKDGTATTTPTTADKKPKRGRLASFISRVTGNAGSPNNSGPTSPSSAVPPVPSLPTSPAPYAYGAVEGYGMDLSDIVMPKPSLRPGALMPSPDIVESSSKKLNSKASKELLMQQAPRQRSNSAADLLRKLPGASKHATPVTQTPAGSSSNLQQMTIAQSASVSSMNAMNPPVIDIRRPGLVKSMSTPAIGPSAQRPGMQSKKTPIQIQTHVSNQRSRPTIIFDESTPPTPSSAATSIINEDEEEEDYGVETNEQERIRREREHEERWAAQVQTSTPIEPTRSRPQDTVSVAPRPPPKMPILPKPTMLGMLASHGLTVEMPSHTDSSLDQRRRLRSMSNLAAAAQVSKSPPASASTTNFSLYPTVSGGGQKSSKGSGFRGLVERMGLGGSGSNSNANSGSSSYPTSPLSPPFEAAQSFPSPPPSAGFAQSASHSPTTSLSIGGPQSPNVFSTGGLLSKKLPKKKLVISGVAWTDSAAYEAAKAWCENFGPVREITRADNDCLYVDFESSHTAETVCRIQAEVFIKGAGNVQLSWSSKKLPM